MTDKQKRCQWCTADPLYQAYHDQEWGVPIYDARSLFELLILEGQQAGLSWLTVLKKRAAYRACFHAFDPEKIVKMSSDELQANLTNADLIRHRLKQKAIITNAGAWLAMQATGINMSDWLWDFVNGVPQNNHWRHAEVMPAETPTSKKMSHALKSQGFTFVGPTICYALMQSAGLVNDHTQDCFLYQS